MKSRTRGFSILFLSPGFLLYTMFVFIPICLSMYYSLTDWNIMGGRQFIFLDNYKNLMTDRAYWQSFQNTLAVIGSSLFIQLPLSLALAYLLFIKKDNISIYRVAYFIPVVISPIAIGTMFSLFYNGELGPINAFLDVINLPGLKQRWLSDPNIVLAAVIIPDIWRYIGYYIILFLSGLSGIPKSLVESAMIDGAGRSRTFFSIILPQLRPVFVVAVVLMVTGSLKSFEFPLALTDGGPGHLSSYLSLYMFKTAFKYQKFGYGSAVTITILIYALVFTVLIKKFGDKEAAE